jgi:hypothetical protein
MSECTIRTVLIDAHVHLYPNYSLATLVSAALSNLSVPSSVGEVTKVLMLVDREGQNSRELLSNSNLGAGVSVKYQEGSLSAEIVTPQGALLVVFGCQCVSREKVEVLGLGLLTRPPEGVPAEEQVRFIQNHGGVPSLPWSPGKWIGKRGKVVHALLDTFGPTGITVSDIALRSRWGPPSFLLIYARSSGFSVLFGSDPLPLAEEEQLVGRFGMKLQGETCGGDLVAWILSELKIPARKLPEIGSRNPPAVALRRFIASNRGKRASQ